MKTKKIEEILESISSDILSDDTKKAITTTFNEAVDAKVKSEAQLMVENELAKLDADHTERLTKLVEAIDSDHTTKFKTVIQQIDEAHTAKLQKVVAKYETELKEGAEKLRNEIVGKISNFLDLYLAETIPSSQLKEAVENIRARKMINDIKKIVAVDPEFVNENFKEALKDGHDTIEKLRKELNEKIQESMEINQKYLTVQSQLILEKKTHDLPEAKKQYVTKLLEGKKPDEIEKNFNFVLEMFKKDEAEKVETLKEKATAQTKSVTEKIDRPMIVKESSEQSADPERIRVVSYLENLEK
jgi:hypothetical protein